MSDWVVAIMFGAGVAGWGYTKLSAKTGSGSSKEAVFGAAVIFILAFVFLLSLFKWVLHIG